MPFRRQHDGASDDSFAPSEAVRAVTDKLAAAEIEDAVIGAAELRQKADHFQWARQPESVAKRIAEWSIRITQESIT